MNMSAASMPSAAATRVFASPLSRALARSEGLDLCSVRGSGPNGRIVADDVRAASAAMLGSDGRTIGATSDEMPLSFARTMAARRMTQSKQRVPHFYLRIDCELDRLQLARSAWRAGQVAGALLPTLNDFIIHAASRALVDEPSLNAQFTETAIRRHRQVHIALAVALDDGLVTPVIRDADRKTVLQIASEARELARCARAGSLPSGASSGGGFSISNLGAYGVREFAAVINPPQAAILAVGVAEQRVVARNGEAAVATMMTVTLSADHRVVDGVQAARWLAAFKRHLEMPVPVQQWEAAPMPEAGGNAPADRT